MNDTSLGLFFAFTWGLILGTFMWAATENKKLWVMGLLFILGLLCGITLATNAIHTGVPL